MADIGNEFDAIFKPEWLSIVHGVEALAGGLEGDVKTELQTAQTTLSTALGNASAAVTAAQAQITTTLNPIVNNGITALGTAITAAYPAFGPLISAAEGQVEALADGGTDAIALAIITKAAGWLSQAAKTTAAVNLRQP